MTSADAGNEENPRSQVSTRGRTVVVPHVLSSPMAFASATPRAVTKAASAVASATFHVEPSEIPAIDMADR